jgi:hypothetical protein
VFRINLLKQLCPFPPRIKESLALYWNPLNARRQHLPERPSFKPSLEELEARRLLTVSVASLFPQLTQHVSQAQADAGKFWNDVSSLRLSSLPQDGSAIAKDVSKIRSDLDTQNLVFQGISQLPPSDRMQADTLLFEEGGLIAGLGVLTFDRSLLNQGVGLASQAVSDYFSALEQKVLQMFSGQFNSAQSSSTPTYEITYNENAPGGPPGRG